jgi:hypothetical protein
MNKSRLLGAVCACIAVFTTQKAMSVTIDTFFGWNYVSSAAFFTNPPNNPISLPTLELNSITYLGAGGSITQAMPTFPSYFAGMPDGEGLINIPTFTSAINGDGETTRTVSISLPIDWIAAGVMTPWGNTYSFPTIGITGIAAQGVPGTLTTLSQYVVGLIPVGANTELASSLGGVQTDIYDISRIVSFSTDPLSGVTGTGEFIFSAASAVPVPAAVWLFGSGLLGLIGMARRKQSA